MSAKFEDFKKRAAELAHLRSVTSTLSWDQETMMPSRGGRLRARQQATLAGLFHERMTDPGLGELLANLGQQPLENVEMRSVQEMERLRKKAIRVPRVLVQELAETASLSYEAWIEARQKSDFELFLPWLKRIFELKKKEAECLQLSDSLYETLLDDYEPGMKVSRLEKIFSTVRPRLTELLERIQDSGRQPLSLEGDFLESSQEEFGREILTAMGFDWEAGRLDRSPHPFCSGLTPFDVRITTRYSQRDFTSSLFGIIHEGGHALYEQGLDADLYGLPVCDAISLGIHESQSRLWENQIGRSRDFWLYWYPQLKTRFSRQLAELSLDEFVWAINRVKASFIRVEADEVTYGLHVILRFELEKALMCGDLQVEDLPGAWNDKMQQYLRIRPPDDSQGVLQDTHWSQGLIGYFPTYLLGNLYSAQLLKQARNEISDFSGHIQRGDLLPLREWLAARVHKVGKMLTADELILAVSGEPLAGDEFIGYLEEKFGELYGLN